MKNKTAPIVILLSASLLIAFLIFKGQKRDGQGSTMNKSSKATDRTLASTPTTGPPLASKKRSNKDNNKTSLPKQWKSKYEQNFLRMHPEKSITELNITHKKNIQKFDGKTKKEFAHILVQFKLPSGDPMSFEALIDPNTGSLHQSWNQTRYEKRKRITLVGTNRLMVTK